MTNKNYITRRKFVYGCSCSITSLLFLGSCTEVPITDRKQIKILSDDYLYARAFPAYEKFKSKVKILKNTAESNKINYIGMKIQEAISIYHWKNGLEDPTTNFEWEFVLVDDDKTINAWCMPGGKIAFYSGILPIANNDDGIATIMGHEVAHAVARHTAERASRSILMDVGTYAFERILLKKQMGNTSQDIYGYLRNLGVELPFNRKQESEADYLGLAFMSLAGYNTYESIEVWKRMKFNSGNKVPPEFFSTHPSSSSRINNLRNWIEEIKINYPTLT